MKPINKYCPRSGKPVQKDSLAEYRGFTVGFCNQSCRDDFESNKKERPKDRHYFDTLIKERDPEPSIEKARPEYRNAVEQLLKTCDLPFEDLTERHLEHFLLIKKNSEIVGTIGLEIYQGHGLLRSLAVRKEYRDFGYGKRLVRAIEDYARENGVGQLYLLTTTAEEFFSGIGYAEINRDSAPDSIRQTEEFSAICPDSAILMKKVL